MKTNNTQKYIIRCDRSGVFYGEIESQEGQKIVLKNARRIWYWRGAVDCIQIAVDGLPANDQKITKVIESMTVLDAIELLPCSSKATEKLDKVPVWSL